MNGNLKYTLSVVCESQKAHAIMMSRTDFLKLKSNEAVWSVIRKAVAQKIDKFSQKIVNSFIAEDKVIENLDKSLA